MVMLAHGPGRPGSRAGAPHLSLEQPWPCLRPRQVGEWGGAAATATLPGAAAHQLTLTSSQLLNRPVEDQRWEPGECAGHWVSVWREAFGKQRSHSCRGCGPGASLRHTGLER